MELNSFSSDKAIQESPNSAQGIKNVHIIQHQHIDQLGLKLISVEIRKQQVQAQPEPSNSQNKSQIENDKPQTPKIKVEEDIFHHHPGKKAEQLTKINRKKPAQKQEGQQNQKKEQNQNQSNRIQSNSESLSSLVSLQKSNAEKGILQRLIKVLQLLKQHSSSLSEYVTLLLRQYQEKFPNQIQKLKAQLVQFKEILWQKEQLIQLLFNKIQDLEKKDEEKQKALTAASPSIQQKMRMKNAKDRAWERKVDQLENRNKMLMQRNELLQQKHENQQPLEQISHIRIGQISPHPNEGVKNKKVKHRRTRSHDL